MDTTPSAIRYPQFSPIMLPACSRSVNASSAERSLLLGVISSHLNILDARDNDSRTLRHKSLLWEQVTQKFNSLSSLPRSRHQIQTLYKNMKAKAKKYQQRMMEAQINDAPHAIPEPDPISELLLQLLAGEHEQRIMHLKQTALNLSGDLTVNVSPDEIIQDQYSPQENCSPSNTRTGEDGNSTFQVKNEPSESNEMRATGSIVSDEVSLGRSASKSPEEVYNNISNNAEDYPISSSAANSNENDFPSLSFSPKPSNKRPRLSLQSTPGSGEQPKNPNQFFRNGTSTLNPREFLNDGMHQFKFNDSHLPIMAGTNKHCCCPGLHAELVSMAKEEHQLRMRATEEERKFKEEQHNERIKLIKLEQELCKRKLKLTDKALPNEKETDNNSDPNVALTLGLNQWDALYSGNNSMNPMNINLGNEHNVPSKGIPTGYHNELDKLANQPNI